jgi:hypothetical protein
MACQAGAGGSEEGYKRRKVYFPHENAIPRVWLKCNGFRKTGVDWDCTL